MASGRLLGCSRMTVKEAIKLFDFIKYGDRDYIHEYGWADDEFLVWVPVGAIDEFSELIVDLFGYDCFRESGLNCVLTGDDVVVYLSKIIDSEELEEVFPKEEYPHYGG